MNQLLRALLDAAEDRFPPVNGRITVVPPLAAPPESAAAGYEINAVMAFTGHAFIATSVDESSLIAAGADGYGGASSPDVLRLIAGAPSGDGRDAQIGVLDATLVGRGLGGGSASLEERTDFDDHRRVRHARAIRHDVRVLGDERGLVTIASGLAGRPEISVEADAEGQGRGWGRSLVVDALRLFPEGATVFAAVAPGNARSFRMFASLGFVVIGGEVVILRPSSTGASTA